MIMMVIVPLDSCFGPAIPSERCSILGPSDVVDASLEAAIPPVVGDEIGDVNRYQGHRHLSRRQPASIHIQRFFRVLRKKDPTVLCTAFRRKNLVIYPPFPPRPRRREAQSPEQGVLLPMPVIRSNLVASRSGVYRRQLRYGELERVHALIRQKIELFAVDHEALKMQEQVVLPNPDHPANKSKESLEPVGPSPFKYLHEWTYTFHHLDPVHTTFRSRTIPPRV
ncbi:hypothetical protein DFH08DRAFT_880672 [Mycena albidolilacea]|uniref:Uncharacterized protein n=1 Tax=Mycena albidolilacea TaxID=1033008 RepID=A0AAD7EKF7_9AGAR|nr:hypothetical protein DFH08DRAFT_880672 [Mycena albidolilacea]